VQKTFSLTIQSGAGLPTFTIYDGLAFTVTPPGGAVTTFGTKSGNAPTLWDHGQDGAGVLNAGWSGAFPNTSSDTTYNAKNQLLPFTEPGTSTAITGPHQYATAALAGNHHDVNTGTGGNNVMAWVNYTNPGSLFYSYWSGYFKYSPNWWFAVAPFECFFTGTLTNGSNTITGIASTTGITVSSTVSFAGVPNGTTVTGVGASTVTMSAAYTGTTGTFSNINTINLQFDNNNKTYDVSAPSGTPYNTRNWYNNFRGTTVVGIGTFAHPNSNSDSGAQTVLNDDGASQGFPVLQIPDNNGHNNFWHNVANATNPNNQFGWVKYEIWAVMSSGTNGAWRYTEYNAPLIVNYSGATVYPGQTTQLEAIGGYARNQGAVPNDPNYSSPQPAGIFTQWRYFNSTYNDRQTSGFGRFVATNSATYTVGGGQISEVQPYTAWSPSTATLVANIGNNSIGTGVLWYVDEANGIVPTPVANLNIVAVPVANLIFDFSTGFSSTAAHNAIQPCWSGSFNGNFLNMTSSGNQHQAGGAWYKTQIDVRSWTTEFTFNIQVSGNPTIEGITFGVQNSNATTNPGAFGTNCSSDANLCGWGGYDAADQHPVNNSIGITFNLNNGNSNNMTNQPPGGNPNTTGMFLNGGARGQMFPAVDLNAFGIDLYNGNNKFVRVVYDGSLLVMTVKDTVTNAQGRLSWPVNIPSFTQGNLGWIGFTGGTIPVVQQNIVGWKLWSGFNPRVSTPTFLPAAGTYATAQNVTISAPVGSTIYYTLDGTDPTDTDTVYSTPISVTANQLIKAIAVATNRTDSLVGAANYLIQSSGPSPINFPSGFTNSGGMIQLVGRGVKSGSQLKVVDNTSLGNAVGAAWFTTPVGLSSFTTTFSLVFNGGANGLCFVWQNFATTAAAAGNLVLTGGPWQLSMPGPGLGYGGSSLGTLSDAYGMQSSVALAFDVYSGNKTGVYTNGATPGNGGGPTITGITLNSGHVINVTLTYSGTTLHVSITDATTLVNYQTNFTIDIPGTVGSTTGYVGFTAATGGVTMNAFVNNWTYQSP